MQETLDVIQNDSAMMLVAGIVAVVVLSIVLIVVVSSMRVRGYRHRFQNLLMETRDKSKYIKTLKQEAEASNTLLYKNKKELQECAEIKKNLEKSRSDYKKIKIEFEENKKDLEKTRGILYALEKKYENLTDDCQQRQKDLQDASEEISKLRTSNARLLMKLEQEVAKVLQNQGK